MYRLELEGRLVAVLLMGKALTGEDDWAVFTGTIHSDDCGLFLEREAKPRFEIRAEWLDRIEPVDPSLKDLLMGAAYYLPLTIGPLAEGESAENYITTGLKWPT